VAREKRSKPQKCVGFGGFEVIVFARFRAGSRQKLAILRARARRGFLSKPGCDSLWWSTR
ncbi:hypothetical protein, partial [Novosphingobium aerophilum]|uniref:hypothetical protein n=1 Tax=Novosphingobium aerophilum TaxID=2839843 RepID=UPI001BE4CA83